MKLSRYEVKGFKTMKKIGLIVSGIAATLVLLVSILWISAYNGAVRKELEITNAEGNVHAALNGRYEKVGVFIDAIDHADATIQGYLTTITEARVAFATAIGASDIEAQSDSANTIDQTLLTLVSYMEDNPSSYQTVGLVSGYLAEISASTNFITTSIMTFNQKVTAYNTHIKTFPNNIFVGARTPYETYKLTNYNSPLPTFDD
jgi:LemA protein